MRLVETLAIGWLETNIRTIILNDIGVPSQFAFVLVTSLDSISDIPSAAVGKKILQQYPDCEVLGKGLLIPAPYLGIVATKFSLFCGFDELWCFDRKPTLPKPLNLSIVSPLNLQDEALPGSLVSWMHETSCKLGLGDGIGLNYVTPDATMAKRIEDTSL
jgi:hypothetical protein